MNHNYNTWSNSNINNKQEPAVNGYTLAKLEQILDINSLRDQVINMKDMVIKRQLEENKKLSEMWQSRKQVAQ